MRRPVAAGVVAWCLAAAWVLVPLSTGHCGTIKGKVTAGGKPLPGAVVSLYSRPDGGFRGAPDFASPPTGPDGSFSVTVPKGQYFVLARKTAGGGREVSPGDFYAYYGGNPVVVAQDETIVIGVNCSPVIAVGEKHRPGGTGIRGKVFADGKPLDRARVTLYQDGDTIFRGIGYASVLTNRDGEFSFNLEPGVYYVVARKRAEGDRMGPLAGGDLFGFAHDNPVEVRRDLYTVVSIDTVAKLVKVKEGGQEVTLGGTVKAGETLIEGTIRDAQGKPVAGVYASAYRDPMMTQKPDFISKKTGPDGSYSILLSEGGQYFIGARNTIGGPAERGDLLGKYDGGEGPLIRIATGEKRKGIDIVVERVE